MGSKVVPGLERLLEEEIDRVAGKRVGLIANPTTVDRSLRHAIDLLHGRPDVELAVLFGPEHGLRSTAQDLIEVSDATDARTGLPIRSLYGATRVPTKEMLAGLDAVVFDIQDVGSRYYTYVWTMAHAMEACARDGIEVIVIVFDALNDDDLRQIVLLLANQMNAVLRDKKLQVTLTQDAVDWIIESTCQDRSYGARPLRRALQKYVEDPLSEAFIRGTIKPGQPVTIFADGDKLGLRQTDAVEEPLSV